MKTVKFKTNINCGGCVAKVTPTLDNIKEVEKWKVDTNDRNKILEVHMKDDVNAELVKSKVEEAGFKVDYLD